MSIDNGLKIIRERILIHHTSPEEREIVDEYTMYNATQKDIDSIFLTKRGFMIGLTILDESGNELPLYSNDSTKNLIRLEMEDNETKRNQLQPLLYDIENRKKFMLWIKLPADDLILPNNSKIIKLIYKNKNLDALKANWKDSLRRRLGLFTIPSYMLENVKHYGNSYDIFYILSVAEGYTLQHKIKENVKIVNMSTIPIKKCDGIHQNVESNSKEIKAISIRIPPIVHETRFKMVYDVLPDKTDRRFYTTVLFALIAVSIMLFLISRKTFHGYENLIDLNSIYTLSHRIYLQIDTIFAGIVTVSLAAIGFMRSYSLNKTRFWFIIPVIISVLGYLFKKV